MCGFFIFKQNIKKKNFMVNNFVFDQESLDAGVISACISSYSIYNVLDFVIPSPKLTSFKDGEFLVLNILWTSMLLVLILNQLYPF